MFVCLFVNFFPVKDFSATTWVRIQKFGTMLDSDKLYCVTKKKQPQIALYPRYVIFAFSVTIFVCLSVCKLFFLSKISQQLLGLGF